MLLSCDNIIYDVQDLNNKLQKRREQGKKIVFTNGCYDILHPGHVYLLEKAKTLGDILIVGINTDDSVRLQNKGIERPVVSLEARAYVLAHLASVDYVIPFNEETPHLLIQLLQPDVLVKGGDWELDAIIGADIVKNKGGNIYSVPLVEGYSTTSIVNKLKRAL